MGMIQHSGPDNFSVQPDNFPLIGVVIPTGIGMFDRHIKVKVPFPPALALTAVTSALPAMAVPQRHIALITPAQTFIVVSPNRFAKIILGPPASERRPYSQLLDVRCHAHLLDGIRLLRRRTGL